jgi:hypothetical protein
MIKREKTSNEDYAYGNSFQIVYDMRTLSFTGTWKQFFRWCDFGISGTFNSYTNDFQQEAWICLRLN